MRATYEENTEIQISPMYTTDERLYLYKDAGYQGDCIEFDARGPIYIPGLGEYGFNDELTSFKVVVNGENSITLFRDSEYKAQTLTFTFDDELSVTSLKNYRLKDKMTWNDRVSSIRVYPGKSKFGEAVSES